MKNYFVFLTFCDSLWIYLGFSFLFCIAIEANSYPERAFNYINESRLKKLEKHLNLTEYHSNVVHNWTSGLPGAKYVADGPKWVILHTYMRGGSTLLGSIFRENPEAFYWYEPISGIYQAMFGERFSPIKIESFNKTTHYRVLSEFENKTIVKNLRYLRNCSLENLPLEFFLDRSNYQSTGAKTYLQCMGMQSREQRFRCHSFVPPRCKSRYPAMNMDQRCHEILELASRPHGFNKYLKLHVNKSRNLSGNLLSYKEAVNMTMFVRCLEPMKNKHNMCIKPLQHQCQKSTLRAIKVIRSKIQLTLDVLEGHNSYMIHQVRDPRGILMSRGTAGLLTTSYLEEAKLICQKMAGDLQRVEALQGTDQYRILSMKYEDLATNKIAVARAVYKFLKLALPEQVKQFLRSVDDADISKEQTFGVIRKNSTQTAFAWRLKMPEEVKEVIASQCQEFLTRAQYDL